MLPGQLSTNAAKLLANADTWIIAPDLHLGVAGRLREMWRYRRILLFFAAKAVQMLYRNTALGPLWLFIRPLAPVVVGSLVFGSLMRVPSEGMPYFLFFLTGSIIWSFFEEPLTRASRALEINRTLLTKLYVPRLILPACQLAAGVVEPIILLMLFAGTVWYYRWTRGIWYGVAIDRLPIAALAALLAIALAFAISLVTSVWQARARDVRYLLGYVVRFWFFVTPVVYPLSMMPTYLRWVAALNPMTGPVEAFRWALLGIGSPALPELVISSSAIVLALASGLWYFTSSESVTIDKL